MYKFGDNQISFSDLGQPAGMKMSAENRWVKKAESIPWGEIEQRYAKLCTNKKGNVAKLLRLALGSCIIQADYGFLDAETRHIHNGNIWKNPAVFNFLTILAPRMCKVPLKSVLT